MKSKSRKLGKPVRSSQAPATAAMLYEMEERLCERMDAGFQQLRSEFHGGKPEIHEIKSEVHGLKSEIHEIKSEVHGLKADIHEVKSEVHRVALLVEEQNARNKFVMDGYAQIYELLTSKE